MRFTEEQELIVGSKAKNLVVNAFAGSGKTSTLVEYAMRRKNERLMYLAYNSAIKEEAKKKFPSNVKCTSTHGLAYPRFGAVFQRAGKLNNPKAYHFAKALDLDHPSAGQVQKVIERFLSSTDREVGIDHVIPIMPNADMSVLHHVVECATFAWQIMTNPDNRAIPCPHDAYLKLYQLSNPIIDTGTILFDECQDANPVTLDFVSKQTCKKVYVGDAYQAIYGFRMAVDALSRVHADQRLLLSTSFRFGTGIANLATQILKYWADCKHKIIGGGAHPTEFSVNRNRPHAVIARTNGGLFGEAVMLLGHNKPFGFVGGVEGARFGQILDTYYLFANMRGSIRDAHIASFADFDTMRRYGEALGDPEIKLLVKVVSEYTHDIPKLISEIERRAISKLTGNEIALTTTHKAKGFEWDSVVLLDDFTELDVREDEKGNIVPPSREEIHILYVALTRTIRAVQVNSSIMDWAQRTGRSNIFQHTPQPAQASLNLPTTQTASSNHIQQESAFSELSIIIDAHRRDEFWKIPSNSAAMADFLKSQAGRFR